jgi:hypothetical protein
LSDNTNTLWDEEFLSTDAFFQSSCATTRNELRLEARDGESCAVQSSEFQLPPDLQRLYENPLDLVEDSLDPKKDDDPNGDDEPWIPRIYAEGDSTPIIPELEVLRKLLVEDPCPTARTNLCCDGPAVDAIGTWDRGYDFVYNCDPGRWFIRNLHRFVLEFSIEDQLTFFLQVFSSLVKENMVFVVSST